MLPDRVSNPGPLTYESGALPIAPRGPATKRCSDSNVPFRLIVFSRRKDATRKDAMRKEQKDEKTKKNAMRKDEITPCEKTQRRNPPPE